MDFQPQQSGGKEELAAWIQQWAQGLRMTPEEFITLLIRNNFQWPSRLGPPPANFTQMVTMLKGIVNQARAQGQSSLGQPPMMQGQGGTPQGMPGGVSQGMPPRMSEEEEEEFPASMQWRR